MLVLVVVLVLVLDLLRFCATTKADFPAINLFARCHGGISSFSSTSNDDENENESPNCRVEIWRGGAKAPFPDPAHQTGRADFPHLGFRTRLFMLSPTAELC